MATPMGPFEPHRKRKVAELQLPRGSADEVSVYGFGTAGEWAGATPCSTSVSGSCSTTMGMMMHRDSCDSSSFEDVNRNVRSRCNSDFAGGAANSESSTVYVSFGQASPSSTLRPPSCGSAGMATGLSSSLDNTAGRMLLMRQFEQQQRLAQSHQAQLQQAQLQCMQQEQRSTIFPKHRSNSCPDLQSFLLRQQQQQQQQQQR